MLETYLFAPECEPDKAMSVCWNNLPYPLHPFTEIKKSQTIFLDNTIKKLKQQSKFVQCVQNFAITFTFSLSTLSIFLFDHNILIFSQKYLHSSIKNRYENFTNLEEKKQFHGVFITKF